MSYSAMVRMACQKEESLRLQVGQALAVVEVCTAAVVVVTHTAVALVLPPHRKDGR